MDQTHTPNRSPHRGTAPRPSQPLCEDLNNQLARRYELADIAKILDVIQVFVDNSVHSRDDNDTDHINVTGREQARVRLQTLLGVEHVDNTTIHLALDEIQKNYAGFATAMIHPDRVGL